MGMGFGQGQEKNIACFLKRSEKNWVGRTVKKHFFIIFLVKNVCFMHVLRLIGSWEDRKNFGVGNFLYKNLLG